MKYLFVDGWADYSIIFDNYRENPTNSVFLLYISALKKINKDTFYINASDKGFSIEQLLKIIEDKQIEVIVFYSTIDNVLPLLRLDLKKHKGTIKVIFLSINEDLSYFLKGKPILNIMNDENKSLTENLKVFFNKCNLNFDDNNHCDLVTDFSLQNDIQEKTITINIGNGCKGECKFCNISNSEISYRNIDIIIGEIRTILSCGIKYFHIANHNFCCDRDFVEKICSKLIELGNEYDFAWSCFVMPSFIINNLDLISLMTEAKMKRIEIGCESGSDELLAKIGINHSQADVETIISSIIAAKIPNIAFHFLIGNPLETGKNQLETKDFIMRLLYLTNSLCDIHLHCYFPETPRENETFDGLLKKKKDFVQETHYLNISELSAYRRNLQKEINVKNNELRTTIPLRVLYEQFELEQKYNIRTQTLMEFITKTYRYELFSIKKSTMGAYYSWEIEENIDEYTPVLVSKKIYLPEENLKSDFSNLNIVLTNYVFHGLSVSEIVALINEKSSGKIGRNAIISILNEWENNLELNYRKYLL
jgi:tRNA A37 methylthiotransferase MiaB